MNLASAHHITICVPHLQNIVGKDHCNVPVRTCPHQVCFYKSQRFRGKWGTHISDLVLCICGGYKWYVWSPYMQLWWTGRKKGNWKMRQKKVDFRSDDGREEQKGNSLYCRHSHYTSVFHLFLISQMSLSFLSYIVVMYISVSQPFWATAHILP